MWTGWTKDITVVLITLGSVLFNFGSSTNKLENQAQSIIQIQQDVRSISNKVEQLLVNSAENKQAIKDIQRNESLKPR